jgi:hypothetical protein
MTLTPLALRPTVDKEGTRLTAEGAAYDAQFVRIRKGLFEKLYGWVKLTTAQYLGVCRSLHTWASNTGAVYLGIGTSAKFYTARSGTLVDITPVRRTVTLGTDPLNTVDGSTTVTIDDTAHGAAAGAYVAVAGLGAALNGVPASEINTEHSIAVVLDANSYTIEVATPASATGAGGGAAITAAYQINPGLASAVVNAGWGASPWGGAYFGVATDIGWGDPASIVTLTSQLRLWSQDNFGEDLVINPRGGGIYYHDLSAGGRAVDLAGVSGALDVPTVCNQVLVSEVDRHIFAYGCNEEGGTTINRMLARWSSQTSLTRPTGYKDWQTRTDNTAGGQQLDHGSEIVRAIRARQETLVFTNKALYSQVFVGPPTTFKFTLLAESIALLAPNAVASTPVGVVWMSPQNFYIYDGSVRVLPSTLRGHVFKDLNRTQAYKALIGHNRAFNEVWFIYPSAASDENDRYVIWNYIENGWVNGEIERTAWLDANPETTYPTAAKAPYLYNHEVGNDDDSGPMTAYVETGDMGLQGGDQFTLLTRILADMEFSGAVQSAEIKVIARDAPGATARETDPFTVTDTAQDVSPRIRGRQLALRVSSDGLDTHWKLGTPRVDIQPDGSN